MIGIHAKMNEKIIHQLTKEEGLTVGADYAAEEIRKLLGPRFLLGPFAGVEMDARFYISNLNTYVPDGLCHGAEVPKLHEKEWDFQCHGWTAGGGHETDAGRFFR